MTQHSDTTVCNDYPHSDNPATTDGEPPPRQSTKTCQGFIWGPGCSFAVYSGNTCYNAGSSHIQTTNASS